MQTTSHFIGIELKSEFFSDIFVKVYEYLKEYKIEECIRFQNPLSPHITLYYLEKDISAKDKERIDNLIRELNLGGNIHIDKLNYFYEGNHNRFIMFLQPKTELNLKQYRDFFHKNLNRDSVKDNNLDFIPHISLLRIKNSYIFEQHRDNIENIIKNEIKNIKNINYSIEKIFLYAVNSKFKEEIQIKI